MTTDWEAVIGLETHVQLSTQAKIFSPAATRFGSEHNTQAHAIDLALPGTLPVLNRGVVERAIRFGLAVDAQIAAKVPFSRKHYFYPDLPKGYQITQYEVPIVQGGALTISVSEVDQIYQKTIQLTRAHLEEDAGKSIHDQVSYSKIDLNRAGIPLLEIVSEPQMNSSAQAVTYAKALHQLVVWLGISEGNMQEGQFRCDANVSVRRKDSTTLGVRCEIKNLNSFRFLEEAIDYEIQRQIAVLEAGEAVQQATRLYDPDRGETRVMRTKEDAADYAYFPDPDLPPLPIERVWIDSIRQQLPELPDILRARLIQQYALSTADAEFLTQSPAFAHYFEAVIAKIEVQHAAFAASWISGELSAQLNRDALTIEQSYVAAEQLASLLLRVLDGTLSRKLARMVFQKMWCAPGQQQQISVDQLIDQLGLQQMDDDQILQKIINQVLADYPQFVVEFKKGKEKALNALIGQVMKQTGGKANPQQVQAMMRKCIL